MEKTFLLYEMFERVKGTIRNLKVRLIFKYSNTHIIAYPKSGTAWLRHQIASYYSKAAEYAPLSITFDKKILNFIKQKVPRIFFSHFGPIKGNEVAMLPEINVEEKQKKILRSLKGKKVIILCRDPRDIIISLFHHISVYHPDTYNNIGTFIRDSNVGIQQIISYLNYFADRRNIFEDLLIVRYEDMQKDSYSVLHQVIAFLGEKPNQEIVKWAAKESSFNKMKEKEEKGKLQPQKSKKKKKLNFKHVNKGKTKAFRDELNKRDIWYLNKELEELNSLYSYQIKP